MLQFISYFFPCVFFRNRKLKWLSSVYIALCNVNTIVGDLSTLYPLFLSIPLPSLPHSPQRPAAKLTPPPAAGHVTCFWPVWCTNLLDRLHKWHFFLDANMCCRETGNCYHHPVLSVKMRLMLWGRFQLSQSQGSGGKTSDKSAWELALLPGLWLWELIQALLFKSISFEVFITYSQNYLQAFNFVIFNYTIIY